LPPEALGQALNCPHCQFAFHILLGADGQPGSPVAGPPTSRIARLPRLLILPMFMLTILGLAGVLVNGYLALMFATVPDADYRYAYGRVIEIRSTQAMDSTQKATDDDWEQTAHAAVLGSAFAIASADKLEDVRNVELARAWQPAIQPTTLYSLAVSALATLAGISMFFRRFYWFCLAGCIAAMLNFNHLCCIPGGIAGFWGILALSRDETRRFFGRG
jgi:hypothetical protein